MPQRILPHLDALLNQITGIVSHYRRILDDEFLFGAAMQIPQVATIFDRVGDRRLHFSGEDVSLTELLTLIAYRYGFENVRIVGHGGYAIVLGHGDTVPLHNRQQRVMRLVPEHHVRNVIAQADTSNDYDVRLDDQREPIRDADYPLLLSDLFLLPRHTTKLVFREPNGEVMQAGGYPASLHCQLLPEVRSFNSPKLDQRMSKESGDLLEAALATLGVSVADAHGGNGGALVGVDGLPLLGQMPNQVGQDYYIPVVLDYGYYSEIGAQTLASVLIRHGVTQKSVEEHLSTITHGSNDGAFNSWAVYLADMIERSGLPRNAFGRLLYHVPSPILDPHIWIDQAERHWKTTKEKIYPPLQAQSRLAPIYPDYDEVLFPQRIEEYNFVL